MSYEAIEDDELLAPQGLSSDDDFSDDEDTGEIDTEWVIAHGFPDATRSVRIWVDEETRKLTRVRLSTRWRERLGSKTLDAAFGEAFFLANARVGADTLVVPELEVPEPDPTLTWDDYERIAEELQNLVDESDELASRAPEDVRWADFQGTQATGTAASGNVTVTLSLAGLTESVSFAKQWLAKARMSEVTDAVMAAHTAAYAKYQPPTFVPGEHEELAARFAATQATLSSIVAKGI